MPKTESKTISPRENPFLTEQADSLWKRLDKNSKPLSKEEIQKRAKEIKEKKA